MLGSVGTMSGPVGSILVQMVQGAQIWVRSINDRGGLHGHRVQLRLYDDGGDGARHRMQVQQAVERDGVLAFLMQADPITGESSLAYVTEKRVPVIGGTGMEPWAYTAPMYFPQQSTHNVQWSAVLAGLAGQVVPEGKAKLGILTCVEASACADGQKVFSREAKSRGLELVYSGQAPMAQPDYTAECLSARNAGVQVLFVTADQNSIRRVAASCARQGFRPTYAGGSGATAFDFKDDPNLDGYRSVSAVFPFFQTGTPAADEYHRAYALYTQGQGVSGGGGAPIGWVAGKLLEKAVAVAGIPEPPTSAGILKALWSVKGDDLGGLTQPLTFREGQPPAVMACGFNWVVKDRTWISPDGFARHCM